MLQKWIWILHMLLWLYTHVSSRACFKCFICFSYMLHMIYLYVSKVDQGVAHVAIHAGVWQTLACRSRLVLLPGAAVVHVRARDVLADLVLLSWFPMRTGAGAGCDAGGRRCRRGAQDGRTLSLEQDLARGEGIWRVGASLYLFSYFSK
jgi:hypothetical protein